MRVERVTTKNRVELLTQIHAFLMMDGWRIKRTDSEKLSATDALGTTLNFNFIGYLKDPTYGRSARSYIEVQNGDSSRQISYFRFADSAVEFNDAYIIGDSKTFILWVDSQFGNDKYALFFMSGYITKTHEFNGGYVSFSSMRKQYVSGSGWGAYQGNNLSYNQIPFSKDSEVIFSLGGAILPIYGQDLREIKFLTNLVKPYERQDHEDYNALSKLSAQSLLNVGKSSLSGLYTLITPNFYYKNNRNVFVHAGSLDFIRVLKEADKFENGQILHYGGEEFMVLRPCLLNSNFQPNRDNYTMAVKID